MSDPTEEPDSSPSSVEERIMPPAPFDFDETVEWILGRPNFWCIDIARALRAAGVECAEKAESEQALVIYWLLSLYLEHGDGWRAVAREKLRQMEKTV